MLRKFLITTFALLPLMAQAEKQVTFKVKEMTCQLCAYLVNQEVRNVDGVRTSKVSLKERQVTIFADEKVKNETLVKAIEKLNYSAQLVE